MQPRPGSPEPGWGTVHAPTGAALLQDAAGSGKPVVLRYNTKAGHSGGLPVSQIVDDLNDVMRFLFWQLNVPVAGAAAGRGGGGNP